MNIAEVLGSEAKGLLEHQCKTIPKGDLHLHPIQDVHLSKDVTIA